MIIHTGAYDGFLDSNATVTDLGANFLPGAINDNGVMLDEDLIDSGGTVQNLNSLIPPTPATPSASRTRSTTTA